MTRIRRIDVLSFIVVALVATVVAPRVLGQDDSAAPDRTIPDLGPELPSQAVNGSTIAPALGDHCHPDFWIVSSRGCQQGLVRRSVCCRFDFARYDGQHRWSDEREFLASMKPGIPVCIVVHGSFVRPVDVVPDSVNMYRWIRAAAPEQPLHVVFYTWPSGGITTLDPRNPASTIIPAFDIVLLGGRAEFNGFYLGRLISKIPAHHRVSLFSHSHGVRVTASALHLIGGGKIAGRRLCACGHQGHRIRVVFAAAAIDHDWLNPGQRYGHAMYPTECLLNFKSRHDLALKIYPLQRLFARRALGRTGFLPKDRAKLGWLKGKISELNITHLVEYGHMIPHYYRQPRIASWMSPWLYYSDDKPPEPETVNATEDGAALDAPQNLESKPSHGSSVRESSTLITIDDDHRS